jgi:hypothetical protein
VALGASGKWIEEGVVEGASPDEAHDVVQATIIVPACVEHGHDARVIKTRRDADLAQESVGVRIGVGVLAGLFLDGDHASKAGVPCRHDTAHAAGAQLTFKNVAIGTIYI